MNLQLKIELQESAQQWVDSIMNEYKISASDMVDALNKILVKLKDDVMKDFIIELYGNQKSDIHQQEEETPIEE